MMSKKSLFYLQSANLRPIFGEEGVHHKLRKVASWFLANFYKKIEYEIIVLRVRISEWSGTGKHIMLVK